MATQEESEKDIKFLLDMVYDPPGLSAASLVLVTYGHSRLPEQVLPRDWSDSMGCKAVWDKIPSHRKKGPALTAYQKSQKYA